MYQVGQLVVYGIHGVCRISQIQDRVVDRVSRRYLVLEPVNRRGSQYFVPMHNPAAMQKVSPLLSREELTALLSSERVDNLAMWLTEPSHDHFSQYWVEKACTLRKYATVCLGFLFGQ